MTIRNRLNDFQEQTEWHLGKTRGHLERQGTLGKTRWIQRASTPEPITTFATKSHKEKCPQDSPKGRENDESTNDPQMTATNVERTRNLEMRLEHPCLCGRKFATQRGMKIHRTKMGCAVSIPKTQEQCSAEADKTSDSQSQDEIHSAETAHATDSEVEVTQSKRPKIKFPPASSKEAWTSLDTEVLGVLKKELHDMTFENKLDSLGDIIYRICKDKFGVMEPKPKQPVQKNRRQRQMEDLRNQKRHLKKLARTARPEEKEGYLKLWKDLKEKHSALSKAERASKKRRTRKRDQDRFFKEPFKYARSLFDQPRSGILDVDQETLEDHLKKTYSDPARNVPLAYNTNLVWPESPGEPFNLNPPTLDEVRQVVLKARCKSAPGPNGIPYVFYKRCPKVLRWLHGNLKMAWKELHISNQWMIAEGVYIPKEQGSQGINQFRPISLLNVEGKIFFSVMASRLTEYLLSNGYVDTTVQKGGVPGIAGCLEHCSMIWEAIQKAKENKVDLDVIWLDLANAYGAVPHQMVQMALEMHHVPEGIRKMLESYFSKFKMRFSTMNYTTNWASLEVGIAMGCTVSPILFVLAMQVLLKAAERKANPANLGKGCQMPPLKAFMDDTTILSSTESETHSLLSHFDDLMDWCRMKFKPKKSRSLSLRKGKVSKTTHFKVGGQAIPTVSEEPVKSLGRWYDDTLRDTRQSKETAQSSEEGLRKIDRCPLPGKYKIWCLQHMLIPMLLWPLLVYEIATTTVEAMESKINKFTRKWLGVPPGLSDVALYCRQAKLRLPLKSITEEYKVGKTRLQLMLQDSSDDVVRMIQPTLKSGRKWKPCDAIEASEESLKLKEVIGLTQTNRQGLGHSTASWLSRSSGKEKRDMIIDEVRKDEDNKRFQKAVQQSQQGQWTNWEGALQKSLSWNEIWQLAPLRLSFIIRSTYDLLPSKTNLVKWNKETDPTCPLCNDKRQTMEHVLSSCRVALANGRYTWRHNRVLEELAKAIFFHQKSQPKEPVPDSIFVSEGGERRWIGRSLGLTEENAGSANLLGSTRDRIVAADLPGEWRENYPDIVKETGQRPDIVVWSESDPRLILIELTVPYESRIEEQHQYKLRKYEDLARKLTIEGRPTKVLPVEVGARGFVAASMSQMLGRLGIKGNKRTKTIKQLAETAEKSSCWLWSKRNDTWS